MSDLDPTPAAEDVGRRTHPLSGLVQGVLWSFAVFAALATSMISDGGWGDLGLLVSLGLAVVGGLVGGLLAGFVTWWFTRYVIDATEVRITSGMLNRQSRRIPFERIQSVDVAEPFIARIVGLAELRIDMAGGKSSRTALRYLPLAEVRDLRRVLLARAHGQEVDAAVEPEDDARSLITRVPPQRLVVGTLLSLDFLGTVVGLVVLVLVGLWFDQPLVSLGGIASFGSAIAGIVGPRLLAQWDFTLSRGERGLRIERGLLSRTSQTIPYDRVQGIAVEEPVIWRRLGWQRLKVDVAGYASQGADQSTSSGNGNETLLPIADPALAAAVVDELIDAGSPLPDGTVTQAKASARAWVFAPIGWRYRSVSVTDARITTRHGWISRTTNLVPHHKTQSVEVRQGPVQRRRGVATVEVHTPPGPVDADADHLPTDAARRLLVEQVRRARVSR